jgi:hypothetical protein
MQTILTMAIWGAAAAGYIAMLVLTERGAARYVRGDTRSCERGQVYVLNAIRQGETPEACGAPVPPRHRFTTEAA